jgi:hypothetical protein
MFEHTLIPPLLYSLPIKKLGYRGVCGLPALVAALETQCVGEFTKIAVRRDQTNPPKIVVVEIWHNEVEL